MLGIMRASASDNLETVKLLVEQGADVNHKNNHGITPLMSAAMRSPEIVSFLIEQGADVRAESSVGYSVLDYAEMSGQQEIIEIVKTAQQNN